MDVRARRGVSLAALVLAALALASSVRAQLPVGSAPEPVTEAVPAPGAAPDAAPDTAVIDARARDLYDLAFQALAQGERALATTLLRELAAMPHPLAARASGLLSTIAAHEEPSAPVPDLPAEPPPPPAVAADDGRERKTGAARAEVAFFQTVHGIALGAELCAIAECNDSQPWALALMLGGGAGFGLSWYFTSDGVRPGLARALTDGVLWGAANGLGLMAATGALDGPVQEERVIGAHLALGQLGGLGLAGGLYHLLEPSAGQVSLTGSGGIWGVAVTAQALGIFEPAWEGQTWAWILLLAGDAGTVAGGFLAAEEPMTTGRVLLVDAGGLLGALTGFGVSVLAQGDRLKPAPTLVPSLFGTLLGLGLTYHLTTGWDAAEASDTPTRLALVPRHDGALAIVEGRW